MTDNELNQIYQAAASVYRQAVEEAATNAAKAGYSAYSRLEAYKLAINIAIELRESLLRRAEKGKLKWE